MLPPVVAAAWLEANAADVVIADVRWYPDGRSGRDTYAAGHLPGAVFVDLEHSLSGPAGDRGRHPLPDPERFAESMSGLGIGEHDTVIGYDDQGGVMAARLVWMLRVTGHPAALLDGGLAAWTAPLTTVERPRPAACFPAVPWPAERLAGIDQVAAPGDAVILDARPAERFRGAPDPWDPRAGHIPGARSLPCRENLDPTGRFLPVAALRQRFADVGVGAMTSVISSCGSGVTACHTLLALELVDGAPGRLYPGSWSEWSRDPDRPVATGIQ